MHRVEQILIDDLGFADTSVFNPRGVHPSVTPSLQELADAGIRLERHYAYSWCSPTRRSFLSGRFPVHISGSQAAICSNCLPLQFTLLSQKLQAAGWISHFVGKGHLGYQTTDHLPVNRGFVSSSFPAAFSRRPGSPSHPPSQAHIDSLCVHAAHLLEQTSHVGYLDGAESYQWGDHHQPWPYNHSAPDKFTKDMWLDHNPADAIINQIFYSTNFFTTEAIARIRAHPVGPPLWIYLAYQGVHAPRLDTPSWDAMPPGSGYWDAAYGDMVHAVDSGVGNLTAAIKQRSPTMWNETLLIVLSDNGGIGPGNNFCGSACSGGTESLRGHKLESWDGGTRTMAFIAGGWLEPHLRGTSSATFVYIADW